MPELDLSQVAIVEVALGAMIGVLLVVVVLQWTKLRKVDAQPPAPERVDMDQTGMVAPTRRLEQDLGFVVDYIKEFPKLMADLNTQTEVRQLPPVLLNAMVRIFRAEQAVVLVRRRSTLAEPERRNRLIVAALASSERGLSVGSEVAMGEGHLGYAAETRKVMDWQDYRRVAADNPRHSPGSTDAVFFGRGPHGP